jgi:hypothetical protein
MLIRSNHSVNHICSGYAAARSSVIINIVLLLVFVYSSTLADFNNRVNHTFKEKGFHGQLSQQSEPGQPNAEFPDDSELEKEPVPDEEFSAYVMLLSEKSGDDTSNNLWLQFLWSLQKRPTISLVILHHSWKSFLI